MKCDVLTLFPGILTSVLQESILKRAIEKGLLEVRVTDLREFTGDRHRIADDYPYGGGGGMVLKPEPIFKAIDQISREGDLRLILLSPQGKTFDQEKAKELSMEKKRIVFICGHYEGIDERVRIGLGPEEVSIGDYVLTGGELAALVIIDASTRLIPGVLGDEDSAKKDSFFDALLDYPHYTRPAEFRGIKVPEVLLSGNHEEIRRWRRREALHNTLKKRPDLLQKAQLTEEDKEFLKELKEEG